MSYPQNTRAPIRAHPFGWLTPLIAQAIERDPARLHAWLGATRGDWHYAGLVLALAQEGPGEGASEVEPVLFTAKRRTVLHRLRPGADPRLLTLAGKLAGRLWPAAAYLRLARLAEEPAAMALLMKARRVTRRQVAGLASVPPAYRHPAVLARLKKPSDAQRLVFAIELAERIRPELSRAQLLRTLGQTPERLPIEAWTRRHFRSASFPRPPWPGDERVRPLTSWDEVQRVAKAFRNCVRSHVLDVLSGATCLYVLREDGRDRAVVEVRRVAEGQWVISEAKGPDNADLPPRVLQTARAALGGVPLLPDDVWIGRYCDPDG